MRSSLLLLALLLPTASPAEILPDSLLAPALDAAGLEAREIGCFPEYNPRDAFRLPLVDSLMTAPVRCDRILPPLLDDLLVIDEDENAFGVPDLSLLTRAHAWLFDVGASLPPLPWESARHDLAIEQGESPQDPADFFAGRIEALSAQRAASLAALSPQESRWLLVEGPRLMEEMEDAEEIYDPLTLRRLEQEFSDRGDSTLKLWEQVDRATLYRAAYAFVRDAVDYAGILQHKYFSEGPNDSSLIDAYEFDDGSRAEGGLLYAASNDAGNFVIGGAEANRYEGDFVFILDLGGDDLYRLASSWVDPAEVIEMSLRGWRAIYDTGGDDHYLGLANGSLAGAHLGASCLVDLSGNDIYEARSFDLGCGWLGLGVLVDGAGDDFYSGDLVVMGAGGAGLGLLRDVSGQDIYRAHLYAQGFAYVGGMGLLEDREGGDLYSASPKYTDILRYEDHSLTLSQGFSIGARPHYSGGVGILYDAAGNDAYLADIYGQGSSYWYALGLLWDRAGNDHYNAYQYAQGAGIHLAVGLLLDDEGNDSYSSHGVGQGCGHDLAFGLLRDGAGNDRYSCDDLSQGAGSANGTGMLLDASGLDGYLSKGRTAPAYGNPCRHFGSVGLLSDGSGEDWVSAPAIAGERRASLLGIFLDRDIPLAGPVWDPGPAVAFRDSSYSWDEYFLMAASGEPRFREWQKAGKETLIAHPDAAIAALIPHFDTDVARQRHTIKDVLLGVGAPAVDPLREVLREGPQRYWAQAAWCLEYIRDPAAFPELVALLGEPRHFKDEVAALAALARLEGLSDTQRLQLENSCAQIAARPDAHPMVLKEIAYLLGQHEIGETTLLLDLATADHYAPRWMAAEALTRREGWGRALARFWKDADDDARRRLCLLLPKRSPREIKQLVRAARRDGGWDDPALRRAVLRALNDHSRAEATALRGLLADLRAEFPRITAAGTQERSLASLIKEKRMSRIVPFEIPSSDAYPLRGNVHLPEDDGAPGVLMVHGFKGFKDWGFMPVFAERLAAAGLAACRFNLSGSGIGPDGESFSDPERFERSTFSREQEDIRLMIDALAAGEIPGAPTRSGVIGLMGHSRGGGGALLAAAASKRIAALVTWAAIATVERYGPEAVARWREEGFLQVENARTGDVFKISTEVLDDVLANREALNIQAAAGRLEIPVLVVHGSEDEAVPCAEAETLAKILGARGSLLLVEGAGHTFGASHPMPESSPADLECVMQASVEHLTRHLL